MIVPASVAYLFIPIGIALLISGVWPKKTEENWWRIWGWSFPDNLYLIFWGIGLIATGLDAAIFGILPIWGK
jgi:hypothetical protein